MDAVLSFLFNAEYWWARFLFQRALGGIYLIAFLVALNQFRPLVGENGLLPIRRFLEKASFKQAPSLFHWYYSDRFFGWIAGTGVMLSVAALTGLSDFGPIWLSMLVWGLLYFLYLSIVNIGQTFYGFGWESILLEAGFIAIFLGPIDMAVPGLVIILLRWLLFRVEFGAGLIKIRGDECWRNLTCMEYHHETQPLPNPLSRFFHHLPKTFHKFETFSNHLVQLVLIWGIFLPQPIASVSAGLVVLSQLYLVLSGNYAWLNWITIVLALSGFSDPILQNIPGIGVPAVQPIPITMQIMTGVVFFGFLVLSYFPVKNMASTHQMMNFSYNPWHLVGTYGAFGSVTKKRFEIIIEGTQDEVLTADTEWHPYEFKGKPGNPKKISPQVAPYHLRLDWQIWFAAMSSYQYHPWFLPLMKKLLEDDSATLKLLKSHPFSEKPPTFVRARLFLYEFSTPEERKESVNWWTRKFADEYLPPVNLGRLDTVATY